MDAIDAKASVRSEQCMEALPNEPARTARLAISYRVFSGQSNYRPSPSEMDAADGPRTPEGKAKVARNAFKGGARHLLRELARAMREQDKARKQVLD
jgi:hypothetical protein